MKLYHFTCLHGAQRIGLDRYLRPNPHPLLPKLGSIVWLTDMAVPDRDALGLTSEILPCDRTRYRVTVDTRAAKRWVDEAKRLNVDPELRLRLERGRLPMHWWVTFDRIVIDPNGVKSGPFQVTDGAG